MRADTPKAGRAADLAGALGHQLARAGYAVVVEGHGMVAQAAARAARQADGKVLAVDGRGGESAWASLPGIDIERVPGLFGSVERVLAVADAVMLLPGDLRAVMLLTQVWAWGLDPDAPYRQTILVGEGWPDAIRVLADAVGLDARTRAMVTFAREAPEAVEALRYYVAPA